MHKASAKRMEEKEEGSQRNPKNHIQQQALIPNFWGQL